MRSSWKPEIYPHSFLCPAGQSVIRCSTLLATVIEPLPLCFSTEMPLIHIFLLPCQYSCCCTLWPCTPCPSVLCALPLPQPATYTVSHSLLCQLLLKHRASHCRPKMTPMTLMIHSPQSFDLYPPTFLLKHHCCSWDLMSPWQVHKGTVLTCLVSHAGPSSPAFSSLAFW